MDPKFLSGLGKIQNMCLGIVCVGRPRYNTLEYSLLKPNFLPLPTVVQESYTCLSTSKHTINGGTGSGHFNLSIASSQAVRYPYAISSKVDVDNIIYFLYEGWRGWELN